MEIIYTRTFRADTKADAEETANCLLLLFKPYRDEEELIGDHRSHLEAFEAEKAHLPVTKY